MSTQTCLVTGAGQGIGRAIALYFAARGASGVLAEQKTENRRGRRCRDDDTRVQAKFDLMDILAAPSGGASAQRGVRINTSRIKDTSL